ncbi:MAG: hypothetical protein EP315_05985 [Gammaproteobacteria bacterium]|nr:MAG: hypothetical protein EP315_05985 [Gammaproteobacteria bacterium]
MSKAGSTQPLLSGLSEQDDIEPEVADLLTDAAQEVSLDDQAAAEVTGGSEEITIDFDALLEESTETNDSGEAIETAGEQLAAEPETVIEADPLVIDETPGSTSESGLSSGDSTESSAESPLLDEMSARNDDELFADSRPASELETAPPPKARQTAAGIGFGVATAAGSLLKKITGTSVEAIEKRRRTNVMRAADRYENAVHNAVNTIEMIGGSEWMKASKAVSNNPEGQAYLTEIASRRENQEMLEDLQRDLEFMQEAAKQLSETSLGAGYSLDSIEDILSHGMNTVNGAVEENLPGLKDSKGESLADRIRKSMDGLMEWVRKLTALLPGMSAGAGPAPGR